MLRGFRQNFGNVDVEFFQIFEKDLRIISRDLVGGFFLFLGGFFHLVLAVVRVGEEVPYVRDVHNALDFVALLFENAAQKIHEHVRAHIADVRVIINRRPAGIHPHGIAFQRGEFFFFARQRVVKFHIRTLIFSVFSILLPVRKPWFSACTTLPQAGRIFPVPDRRLFRR